MNKDNVVIAHATSGFKRIIVKDCPYCHHEHTHSFSHGYDDGMRLADCCIGEYKLVFENSISKND